MLYTQCSVMYLLNSFTLGTSRAHFVLCCVNILLISERVYVIVDIMLLFYNKLQ
jgi:hypothetical protein